MLLAIPIANNLIIHILKLLIIEVSNELIKLLFFKVFVAMFLSSGVEIFSSETFKLTGISWVFARTDPKGGNSTIVKPCKLGAKEI